LVLVGCVQSIPYFIFGVFITILFRSIGTQQYHAIYAADLIGAAAGCVLAIVSLEYFSYRGGTVLILVSTLMASFCFYPLGSRAGMVASVLLAGVTTLVMLSEAALSAIEPHPSLAMLGRDYNRGNEIDEKWHVWNGQSRVGLIEMVDRSTAQSRSVYSHENGDGWAVVGSGTPSERLVTMFRPKRVLVMFAGVGADMVSIDENCGGTCEITGV
jgi:hypothetical protein